MKVRYTPKFLKRHQGLVDGEAKVEAVSGRVKLTLTDPDGRCFWIFVDPIELANVALGQVPIGRVEEVAALPVFKRLLASEEES